MRAVEMRTLESVAVGMLEMSNKAKTKKTVAALLTFQTPKIVQRCFLFTSSPDHISQLVTAYGNDPSVRLRGESSADMQHLHGARQTTLGCLLAIIDELEPNLLTQIGHAEEFLVRDFSAAHSRLDPEDRRAITHVNIYLSHSPCLEQDSNASGALPGLPDTRSCTRKLINLAAAHPQYSFSVLYDKEFGAVQGGNHALLNQTPGKPKNLSFVKR
ncbi:MAG: hypothetical protein ABW321_11875 [Polyangiales bacterium]